ncbi:MAG TPA: hypothetical protein VGQ36_03530 [Thermoanaerobaculia bacterium]|jgi:hypothetical protein|nr:hypothetical protein [Thermoanaerobaculia bacterium]
MALHRVVLAAGLFICALAVRGFDGKEHRFIASTGMRLAVDYCKSHPGVCDLDAEEQRQLDHFANPHSSLEYGLLVSSVDYRLNALQLLQKQGTHSDLPMSPGDLDPHLIKLLTRGGTAFFRAAAANETHFQGDLVAGIRNWHAYAVSIAAGTPSLDVKPNLYGALLVNSISDHFLHDFFAPGHIITPRFGLHDAVALSMHNRYNAHGARFKLCPREYDQLLKPLLDPIKDPRSTEYERFKDVIQEVEDGTIELWGDSQLSNSREQELFLVLLSARSILDVLMTTHEKPVNSFLQVVWHPMTRQRDAQGNRLYEFARAELPFGKYVHRNPAGRKPKTGLVLNLSVGAEMLTGRDTRRVGEDKETTARVIYAVDALVASALPLDADQHATDLTRAVPVHYKERRQRGLTLGYVFAHNATETAQGVSARVIWSLPMLHSQVSADLAEKIYDYKDQSARRTAYGARLQAGFSLLLLDVGVSREWTYGRRGRLMPETSVRFGGTIVTPLSSIPYIGALERRFYGRGRPNRRR